MVAALFSMNNVAFCFYDASALDDDGVTQDPLQPPVGHLQVLTAPLYCFLEACSTDQLQTQKERLATSDFLHCCSCLFIITWQNQLMHAVTGSVTQHYIHTFGVIVRQQLYVELFSKCSEVWRHHTARGQIHLITARLYLHSKKEYKKKKKSLFECIINYLLKKCTHIADLSPVIELLQKSFI